MQNPLLNSWQIFMKEIALGYPDEIYEYINDVSVREELERALDTFSERELSVISKLDQEYNEYTLPRALDIFEDRVGWWYHRIPKNVPIHMVEDFKSYGIDYSQIPEAEIIDTPIEILRASFPEYYSRPTSKGNLALQQNQSI